MTPLPIRPERVEEARKEWERLELPPMTDEEARILRANFGELRPTRARKAA